MIVGGVACQLDRLSTPNLLNPDVETTIAAAVGCVREQLAIRGKHRIRRETGIGGDAGEHSLSLGWLGSPIEPTPENRHCRRRTCGYDRQENQTASSRCSLRRRPAT